MLAGLFAARQELLKFFLAFALLDRYDLGNFASELAKKQVRFYIGNRDTRVGTQECFECLEKIAAASDSPPSAELFIRRSIGQMGHGTPPEVFSEGADWIYERLKI